MKERYLVIGSNSFSGAHYAAYLAKNAQEVYGVSRSNKSDTLFCPELWHYKKPFSYPFFQLDLNKNFDEIRKLLDEVKPSIIVNFSAQGMVAESWNAPLDWFNTNLMSQVRLHDYLRETKFLKKYLHVTTPEVYGESKDWISESFAFSPSTPYAVSRAACDLHLMSFFKAYNFPVVFSRSANVYGPGQQLYRVIPRAIIAAKTGEKFDLHGGGVSRRSFIHIDDVVSATHRIVENGEAGETFHISTNQIVSIAELVSLIASFYGKEMRDICIVSDERLGKDSAYMLDSSKIRKNLFWSDSVELSEGLLSVKNWVDSYIKTINELPKNYIHKT